MIDIYGIWMVTNEKRGYNITGHVPGSMYTALLDNKLILDPYYRKNDDLYRWIARDDWTYTRTFNISSEMKGKRVALTCEGLDTIATVYVNEKLVGTSDNMFVRYTFDIQHAIKPGVNDIKVAFKSAVVYAEERYSNHPYLIPPKCVPPQYKGECHVQMIRKEQCSFSWDWGPSFPTQGIWRNISIHGYDSAVISYVTAETHKGADLLWNLVISVFMDVASSTSVDGQLEVRLDNTTVSARKQVTVSQNSSAVTFNITVPKTVSVKLWWPNGFGNQSLYSVSVSFTSATGKEISNKRINIGFRTVELIQDYVSQNTSYGRHFYFKINGLPIFLKGSNWIPADSFLERVTRDKILNLLQSAKDVHMNVLRVWGGGVYESDEFYEIADELGIMLWQDFMFGCAMYPTDQSFLDSVKSEITHQIRRLKHHASIIIWSGNNENEKALRQSWYNTDVNFTLYRDDYLKLYKDTISPIVMQEDPHRPFIPSSPTNGLKTEEEGWVSVEPWSELYGDIHDYRYMDPFFEDSVYRIPRMSSEYGLQSLPSYETLKNVYAEEDMNYWSDMNEYRQHHPLGNIQLQAEIIMFINPPNSPDLKQRFRDLIYVTQINQAIAMKTETEHYRRWQNKLADDGRGNTMGAMYWQLNDIWQAPTWASIEYGGKWKMLHYYARHFFSPLLIAPYLEGDDVVVYICVDKLSMFQDDSADHQLRFKPTLKRGFLFADNLIHSNSHENLPTPDHSVDKTLYVQMYSWDSMTPLYTWTQPFKLNISSEEVFRKDTTSLLREANCIRNKNCFLYFHLGDAKSDYVAWQPLSTYMDAIGLQKANIQVTDLQTSTNSRDFVITLTTNAIAPFVWLEVPGVRGRFSDNGFLMVHPQKVVTFHAWDNVDKDVVLKLMSIKSLMDIYV